ncbi:hypothetical protein VFPFJ_10309 [Purpureocillium lilacinum]|uniref:Uncharacterized protein n=1 Tax=Purpureocillium lilacinum TaxID=33203 RepID=A0A179GJF5_PURLI|nr:hypothetical protein VFPFJ_10309 [Purpureocillium lilacinum]OAQ77942.1 hypothetical protein VFPFJ_10309 [Purpureocillium lilacinum]OAQ87753.1 hypothetical protein VFPBJ_01794 [Purpureocillium lilacinum]
MAQRRLLEHRLQHEPPPRRPASDDAADELALEQVEVRTDSMAELAAAGLRGREVRERQRRGECHDRCARRRAGCGGDAITAPARVVAVVARRPGLIAANFADPGEKLAGPAAEFRPLVRPPRQLPCPRRCVYCLLGAHLFRSLPPIDQGNPPCTST